MQRVARVTVAYFMILKPRMNLHRWHRHPVQLCFIVLLFGLVSLVQAATVGSQQGRKEVNRRFWIANDMFWRDEGTFQIFGGDIHYFRIHPEYWEDRLRRAKALGLNTIQTYVPWNVHEPRQGEFHFEGSSDLERFLVLAQKLELLVMLRIGPYICAEWDFGGFPAWLLAHQPQLRLRSSDPAYLNLVDKWWSVLLPKIAHLVYDKGGPVIMVQIENEFGSYGKDKDYLKHLVDQTRFHLGESIIIYTTDGGSRDTLENGTLRGNNVYAAVDFPTDWDAAQAFALQKKFNDKGKSPSLASEFYTGWLTHWREKFSTTDSEQTAAALDKVLSLNASVVLYMAHGGTNFGFYSGANTGTSSSDYEPDITSYDYDAPISEAGDVDHSKFLALKRVFAKHSQVSVPNAPSLPSRMAYGKVNLEKKVSLFHVLQHVSVTPNGTRSEIPCTMESLNQISGFILYETSLPPHSTSGSTLLIPEVHDRAQVFVSTIQEDGQSTHYFLGIIERWSKQHITLPCHASSPGSRLKILVENMGRVNYGAFLYDPKGILSSVLLDEVPVIGWTIYSIPLDDVSAIKSKMLMDSQPEPLPISRRSQSLKKSTCKSDVTEATEIGFYSGLLQVEEPHEPADTFLSLKGWKKGVAFINGFNLGRYWTSAGPQCTLYIPAPLLLRGQNELMIFELDGAPTKPAVEFVGKEDFTCGLSREPGVSIPSALKQTTLVPDFAEL